MISLLHDILIASLPLILAAEFALYSEFSANLNIALEGYLSFGAFLFAAANFLGFSIPLAFLFGLGIISLVSVFQAVSLEKSQGDPFVIALAFNLILPSIASLIAPSLTGTRGSIPTNLGNQQETYINFALFLSLFIPILSLLFLRKTRWGMIFRSNGLHGKMLDSLGNSVGSYRILGTILAALGAYFAGCFLALKVQAWFPGISSGRGWIALVLIYAGKKNPLGILLVCLIYSATEILGLRYQWLFASPQLALLVPYVALILLLSLGKLLDVIKAKWLS